MKRKVYDHPSYYNSGKIEVIDVIEDWDLNFSLGSVVKYAARCGKKAGETVEDDLTKALWYLKRDLKRIKKARRKMNRMKKRLRCPKNVTCPKQNGFVPKKPTKKRPLCHKCD